jgi:hypothetical protein
VPSVKIELEVDLNEAAHNSLTPEDLQNLSGWKVMGVGVCDKHGNGVIFIGNPEAELFADTYASLNCLSKGATEVFRVVTKNARKR